MAPEGDCLLREVASLYILLTERDINWRESELQLFLVHSRSLHRMQHYLTPSVIYVMNWESEDLLVLDLLCAQVANCLYCLHVGGIPSVPHVGDSSTPSKSLVALPVSLIKKSWRLLLQHIQVFECRNDAGLCL